MPRKAAEITSPVRVRRATTRARVVAPAGGTATLAEPLCQGTTAEAAFDMDLFGSPVHADDRVTKRALNTTNTQDDGVFGWFKYVQDFPGDFALAWLRKLAKPGAVVWEPFCGSGTTLVASQMLGLECHGYDINPFMVDVAEAKLDWTLDPKRLHALADRVAGAAESESSTEPADSVKARWTEYESHTRGHGASYPGNDDKLERWMSPLVLSRCQSLLRAVASVDDARYRRFLRLAAAQILIPASNMTFRPNICYEAKATVDYPVVASFRARVAQMLVDYKQVAPYEKRTARAMIGDARSDGPERADVIFTSPPYPNDMEYVHQTRLELALLDYVSSKRHLTVLKKRMISSSVKLVYRDNEWQKTKGLEITGIKGLYAELAETLQGRNWGWNAADMVAQFFGGMRVVAANWYQRLTPGGVAAVVIGDSAFNGVKVNSDTLLAQTAVAEGFELVGIEPFRQRWNPKHTIELRESVVLLRKPSKTKQGSKGGNGSRRGVRP